MKSAVRLLLLTVALLGGIGGVPAQTLSVSPTGKDRPPVAVSGWRYDLAPNDVHMFLCEEASCIPGSKVSYRFYAAGDSMTLETFRSSQQQVAKALEQRSPGQRITILGVEGDSGTAVPRLYKARRKTVAADGASEYVVSAMLFGSKAAASLISSSRDEKASNDNYAQFALAVMLLLAPAQAAPPPETSPPVSMKNWRYEKGARGLYTFYCEPPACASKSTVVYQLLSPGLQMSFDQYRQSAEPITKEMQAKNTHGARFQLLGVDDASKVDGTLPLRMYKTRRLVIPATGPNRIMITGYVFGTHHTASITSSAEKEKTADANFMQFSAPLWLIANDKLERR